MVRLNIKWRNLNNVAPVAATTGEAKEQSGRNTAVRADKPMMIYVQHDDNTETAVRKLEDVVFADERVALGTKFFDTIKISAGDALQDRILKETGKQTPRMVFLKRDYSVISVMKGKQLSAAKLLKSMSRLAKKEYTNSFDKMIKAYRKVLNDIDRLEGKKQNLAQQRARLQGKPNASKEKKIAREEKKLEGEFAKVEAAEKKLLQFKSRGKKPEA